MHRISMLLLACALPAAAHAAAFQPGQEVAPKVDTVVCPWSSIATKLADLDMSQRQPDAEDLMNKNGCDIIMGYSTNQALGGPKINPGFSFHFVATQDARLGIFTEALVGKDVVDAHLSSTRVFFAPVDHFDPTT